MDLSHWNPYVGGASLWTKDASLNKWDPTFYIILQTAMYRSCIGNYDTILARVSQIILSVPHFVNRPPQRVFVTSFNVGFSSAAPSTSLGIWNKCTFFILADLKWPDDDIEQLFGSFCVFSARAVGQVVCEDISRLFSKTLWSLENCLPCRNESHIDENTEDYVVGKASSTVVNLVNIQTP